MKFRAGLEFGLQVVGGVSFAQLFIVAISPPTDLPGYFVFVLVMNVVILLITASVASRRSRSGGPPVKGSDAQSSDRG